MKSIKYLILTLGLIVGFGLAAVPTTVSAATVIGDACKADDTSVLCKNQNASATDMVRTVVNALMFILGAVSVLMIIVGGIRYATSMGDAKNIESAKNTILYAVVGLVVALLAYAIVNFVVTTIK